MALLHTGPLAVYAGDNDLRVLHVINSLGPGGAEALLYRMVTRPSDIDHVVVALAGRDRYSAELEEHGIAVHHLEMTSIVSFARGLRRLNRLIRDCDANVVQTWMYRSNVLGGLCARAAGIPVVWGIHCSSLEPLGLGSRLLVYLSGGLASWVPNFIVNCSSRSEKLHRRLGYGLAPGGVIHNGYDEAAFHPDQSNRIAYRKLLGVSGETFLIGSIGRWHPQKGISVLLRAARAVSARGVPLRCLLIGRGLHPENSELMTLILDSGCSDIVQALGERTDVPEIARALDLHVLASIGSEAFPNVVSETMLSGTPNVVTDVGDSAVIVGHSGWVVPPRDPEQLAAAIEQAWKEWTDEQDRWDSRRASARRRIATKFTLDGMAAAYEQIWRGLAATA